MVVFVVLILNRWVFILVLRNFVREVIEFIGKKIKVVVFVGDNIVYKIFDYIENDLMDSFWDNE